jgi:acetyltransferase-like isoleucine patch superfamily enzyme
MLDGGGIEIGNDVLSGQHLHLQPRDRLYRAGARRELREARPD